MDYKNKYEQALERARIWKDKSGMPKDKQGILDDIFPELKESEDERIINLLKMVVEKWRNVGYADYVMDIPKSDIFTWLEKQGEHANFRNKIQIGDKVTRNKDGMLVNLSQLNRVAKQGEPDIKEPNSEDERIRKELIVHCRNIRCVTEEGAEKITKWITWLEKQEQKPQGKSALEAAKEEKTDNQNCVKHTDKIESMFHKGEWIVHHGTENIYQVVSVIDNQYQLKYGDTYTVQKCTDVDKCARLWDIAKDAKDGDVLSSDYEGGICIALLKNVLSISEIEMYCHLINDDLFIPKSGYSNAIWHPATKEQRDTLFAKMKEAGYEWNAKKKELKKIEQKPTDEEMKRLLQTEYEKGRADAIAEKSWSEEDEDVLEEVEEAIINYWHGQSQKDLLDWLKSLKDRVQPKQEWSEEDKEMFEYALDMIEWYSGKNEKRVRLVSDWLKSLKPQSQWKPSEEQIEILDMVLTNESIDDNIARILRELQEALKKLKG